MRVQHAGRDKRGAVSTTWMGQAAPQTLAWGGLAGAENTCLLRCLAKTYQETPRIFFRPVLLAVIGANKPAAVSKFFISDPTCVVLNYSPWLELTTEVADPRITNQTRRTQV